MENIIWKDVVGYEGLYQVSNTGLVKSLDRYANGRYGSKRLVKGRIMSNQLDKEGYVAILLYDKDSNRKRIRVNRLVANAFLPNPNNLPFVLHRNDVRNDNRVDNLMWGTHKDNMDDMVNKGRQLIGNRNHQSKLTDIMVMEIKSRYTGRRGQQVELAKEYGVSKYAINLVLLGKSWKHI